MSAAHLMHLDSPPIAKYEIWLDLNRLKAQGYTTVVSDETCAMYDNCVARLRENVLDVSLPSGEVTT